MSGSERHPGQADELMVSLRRLRRLVSQRDRLPFDSRDRMALDDEIDLTQRETWRLASEWTESESGATGRVEGE